MRLAVFTNQFPSRLTTFFARDMRALIEAGVMLDVFPLYPLDPALWDCVPPLLDGTVLPRARVHHLAPLAAALPARGRGAAAGRRLPGFVRDAGAITRAALRYGPGPAAKSLYAALEAWAWARRHPADAYDHVLAYWGNYSASAAYLYHRLTGAAVPFSMFVHARMDLYERPAFLAEKMLHADNVFIVCDYNRRYLARAYAAVWPRLAPKVHLHHLGLDLAATRFVPDPRPPAHLLGVGRLEPLKGFDHLVRAAGALRRRGWPVTVELIGAGEAEPALRALAVEAGVGDRVVFAGWRAPAEVEEAMRRATLLVHPSVAPDAMPTVVKEAMAVGTPVVASRLAGIPEMLDDGRCGVLVPPGDGAALEAAIAALLAAPAERARLARAARARCEEVFDLWRNGRALAARLAATRRAPALESA
ncbi:MAG TPA: glycosyltransferase [Longimicrobiales bacterium]|nr:glycosyltransferase [Longimicrobiales bacterium]